MYLRNPYSLLVYLAFIVAMSAANAQAWNFIPAAAQPQHELYAAKSTDPAPVTPPLEGQKTKAITKVKPREQITKCKPDRVQALQAVPYGPVPSCILPIARPKGWEMNAELFYARAKGKVKYARGVYGYQFLGGYVDELDLNNDLGIPDHGYMPEFSATYRFRHNWSLRYSIMPVSMEGPGNPNKSFVFGSHTYNTFQNTKGKWERVLQRVGMVYEPVRTYAGRISVFGDYVRIDDKLSFINPGCCGDTMQ
ncbi:MAG: hypothetical protein FJY85_07080, partial [Deltaproteobacteria bacterium]|nr:hypothetical protein [Deltaproteobacteria bacterium]